jgi:glyceraldehyde 3-phosphate dehydrogenase
MTKVAINGFGRIGRSVFKIILENYPNLDVVAINDLSSPESLAHLLKYDSIYGTYSRNIKVTDNGFLIDVDSREKEVMIFSEKDPEKLPWEKLGVDIVIESTGIFRDYFGAQKHIKSGAKKVIISAPSKDPEKIPSYIIGINHQEIKQEDHIIDMGSCTTNCLAPVLKIISDNYGFEKGFMTTIHSYTNDQRILDLNHPDLRRARAAALNIIPTTTGAAKAIGLVLPHLKGRIDGVSLRVPTPTVSIIDLFCEIQKETIKEELNDIFNRESKTENYNKILKLEEKPLVSSDYIGSNFSSIIDSSLTMVNKKMVKVMAWYDNEWGYSTRLADLTGILSNLI